MACPGLSNTYSPDPKSLMMTTTSPDRARERFGGASREMRSAPARWVRPAIPLQAPAKATMRSQRSGSRSTRRSALKPCAVKKLRGHAIGRDHELLDQLLRSIGFIGTKIAQDARAEHRLRLDRLQVQRAACTAHFAQRLRHFVLGSEAADPCRPPPQHAAGAGPAPASQAPTAL